MQSAILPVRLQITPNEALARSSLDAMHDLEPPMLTQYLRAKTLAIHSLDFVHGGDGEDDAPVVEEAAATEGGDINKQLLDAGTGGGDVPVEPQVTGEPEIPAPPEWAGNMALPAELQAPEHGAYDHMQDLQQADPGAAALLHQAQADANARALAGFEDDATPLDQRAVQVTPTFDDDGHLIR